MKNWIGLWKSSEISGVIGLRASVYYGIIAPLSIFGITSLLCHEYVTFAAVKL